MRVLLSCALLSTAIQAAVETTEFTKVVGTDGIVSKFISLDPITPSYVFSSAGSLLSLSKVRLEPLTMELLLDDVTFAVAAPDESKAKLDLEGTLFTFKGGEKVA